MNAPLASLTVGITTVLLVGLSSCSVAPPPTNNPSPFSTSTNSPTSSATPMPSSIGQPPSPTVTPTAPVKTTTINIYKVDSLCNGLTPEKVTIAAKQSLEGAIAKVLEETDSGDFSIAGYRVSREGDRAIVDFRLPANAKRQFRSLSSCEQLALFGGIRKTLTDNAQWNIKSVQFTEKGEEIVL